MSTGFTIILLCVLLVTGVGAFFAFQNASSIPYFSSVVPELNFFFTPVVVSTGLTKL